MNFVVDQFTFLGLNEREIKVFTAIGTFGRMNMTKIAARSQLSRTTVDAIVRRLIKQGLVSKEKVHGHYEYFMKPEDVADKLDWIEQRIRPKASLEQSSTKNEAVSNDENNVITSNFIEFLDTSFKNHQGNRMRLMLARNPNDTVQNCLQRLSGYVRLAVENSCKLEVLLSSEIADALCGLKDVFPCPLQADDVRLNIVPASYGAMGSDLCVFHDAVLLIHPSKSEIEHITHNTFISLSSHLLAVASEVGWSVNLVAWLNKTQSTRTQLYA